MKLKNILTGLKNIFRKKESDHKRVYEPVVKQEEKRVGERNIPIHNNRKTGRGRRVQYINMGDGSTRPIFHSR